jgi:membrane-associated phospholipid phosphatase
MANIGSKSTPAELVNKYAPRLKNRALALLLLLTIQFLYFPINRTMTGGVLLDTPWDASIPLWPIWVIPYLLSLAWWTGCYLWATLEMEDDRFRAFVIALIAVMLASYVVYILYPTYVIRPIPQGDGWLAEIVRHLYAHDRVNNAFPSGHTYNTVLLTLFWWNWYPRQRWLWLTVTVVVLLSTLFTRQHNLPDLVGGVIFAWLGYHFGWWVVKRRAFRT